MAATPPSSLVSLTIVQPLRSSTRSSGVLISVSGSRGGSLRLWSPTGFATLGKCKMVDPSYRRTGRAATCPFCSSRAAILREVKWNLNSSHILLCACKTSASHIVCGTWMHLSITTACIVSCLGCTDALSASSPQQDHPHPQQARQVLRGSHGGHRLSLYETQTTHKQ